MLHVSHGDPDQPVKRIDKVKKVVKLLVTNFQSAFAPSRDLSVDETMVGFRGRFGPKQYMPQKNTKYGIKAFTLAESEHGYVLNVLVYTGRETLESASLDALVDLTNRAYPECPGWASLGTASSQVCAQSSFRNVCYSRHLLRSTGPEPRRNG